MRKIIAAEFLTLDGVMEASDTWHPPYVNDEMGALITSMTSDYDAMVLGRRTYEEFAAAWPARSSADFGPLADFMNQTPKLVASTTLDRVEWQNSMLIEGDVIEAISKLKQLSGKNIFIPGSATLVQSLLLADQIDQLQLIVDPIVVGSGKRLFETEGHRMYLRLVDSRVFSNGVLSLVYAPAPA